MVNKSIFSIRSSAKSTAIAFCLSIGTANADKLADLNQSATISQKITPISDVLPKILSKADADRYRKIFHIQNKGHWREADSLIINLTDNLLLGHVLAQRYLHPTKYRSRYKELRDWMALYADHPDARRIYKLALRRKPKNWRNPAPPHKAKALTKFPARKKIKIKGRTLSAAGRSKVRSHKRQIRQALRRGHTLTAKKILQSHTVKSLFSKSEYDEASYKLGQAYFNDGRDEFAMEWAGRAAKRSGNIIPGAYWTLGLASWRLGLTRQAANHFEKASHHSGEYGWFHSAAAFWTARANMVTRQPQKVAGFLKIAAAKPHTFYGLLARRILGVPFPFDWNSEVQDKVLFEPLSGYPRGQRAIALLQINQRRRASRELRNLAHNTNITLAHSLLGLAEKAGMAELAVRLNERLFPSGGGSDTAAYPIPQWKPGKGLDVDRALIYAITRQESRFNPMAKSWAGARGLMQLMPTTARFVARTAKVRYNNRRDLFRPEFNLRLGQHYIKMLLTDPNIKNDLFLLMAAWNGGPGNLSKWRRRINDLGDPLFFIESLPSRETRNFIEHTLANLWIYRHRLGQSQPSLNAIAAGQWPVYIPQDQNADGQGTNTND